MKTLTGVASMASCGSLFHLFTKRLFRIHLVAVRYGSLSHWSSQNNQSCCQNIFNKWCIYCIFPKCVVKFTGRPTNCAQVAAILTLRRSHVRGKQAHSCSFCPSLQFSRTNIRTIHYNYSFRFLKFWPDMLFLGYSKIYLISFQIYQ